MAKIIHIGGVVAAYLAAVALIIAGIADLGAAGGQPPGQLITWGVAIALASTVAVLDGARAVPQLGMWKVGAKFSGLGDLAVILIIVIMAIGIGVSFVF